MGIQLCVMNFLHCAGQFLPILLPFNDKFWEPHGLIKILQACLGRLCWIHPCTVHWIELYLPKSYVWDRERENQSNLALTPPDIRTSWSFVILEKVRFYKVLSQNFEVKKSDTGQNNHNSRTACRESLLNAACTAVRTLESSNMRSIWLTEGNMAHSSTTVKVGNEATKYPSNYDLPRVIGQDTR